MRVLDERRQDADGRPYVAWFHAPTGYGFCWAGDIYEPVEVTKGGMGEPVIAVFPLEDDPFAARPARRGLLAFHRACETWIAQQGRGGR